jgi:DNA polymerase-1
MKALIDGDVYLYQAVHRGLNAVTFDGEHYTYGFHLSELLDDFRASVEGICLSLKTLLQTDISPVICLSSGMNFRKERIDTQYKANRSERKPLALGVLREAVIDHWFPEIEPGMEADDVMGILHTKTPKKNTIVCSIDKDMFTLPGYYYNTDHQELHDISRKEAEEYFLRQVLAGDRVDNYFGCPGVGEKTAHKLFDEHGYSWATVLEAYKKAGLSYRDALRNARCAFILQADSYNTTTKHITLWTPKCLKLK